MNDATVNKTIAGLTRLLTPQRQALGVEGRDGDAERHPRQYCQYT